MATKWIILDKIGPLYTEKILVTFDEPILFVCKDEGTNRYLCMSYDDCKYVVAKTDSRHLVNMLTDKVSMEKVFRDSRDGRMILVEYDLIERKLITQEILACDAESDILPQKEALLELSSADIEEYIAKLEKDFISIQNESFCEKYNMIIPKTDRCEIYEVKNNKLVGTTQLSFTKTSQKCLYNGWSLGKMIA